MSEELFNKSATKEVNVPTLTMSTRTRSQTLESTGGVSSSSFCDSSITPIRPLPIVPPSAAFSFDSGLEVSPLFTLQTNFFRYGEPEISEFESNNGDNMRQSTIDTEGFDEELVSIDHHFTPIQAARSVPSHSFSHASNTQDFVNLASYRRKNRLSQQSQDEVNNNELCFPNLNQPTGADEGYPLLDIFPMDEGDDDVFLDDDQDESFSQQEPRSWHITRPSCIISEKEPDMLDNVSQDSLEGSSNSSQGNTSRRSSTPIPIPGSVSSEADLELFIDSNLEPSLPAPNRMPFYHHMAPPLNIPPRSSKTVESTGNTPVSAAHIANNNTTPTATNHGHTFGTHFQKSCSIISRHLMTSRYSPVPYLNQWNTAGRNEFIANANSISLAIDSSYKPHQFSGVLGNDGYHLAPHLEIEEDIPRPMSPYGMVFNFSQLSVNEVSGALMDLEVPDGPVAPNIESVPVAVENDLVPLDLVPSTEPIANDTEDQQQLTIRESLPDVVISVGSHHQQCRRSVSFTVNNNQRNTAEQQQVSSFQRSQRRTMSLDEDMLSQIGRELREISNEFLQKLQMQRYNPATAAVKASANGSFNSMIRGLLTSGWYSRTNRRVTRRQTFNGDFSNIRASNTAECIITGTNSNTARVVNNSRFYTTTTTTTSSACTGNSTFYLNPSGNQSSADCNWI